MTTTIVLLLLFWVIVLGGLFALSVATKNSHRHAVTTTPNNTGSEDASSPPSPTPSASSTPSSSNWQGMTIAAVILAAVAGGLLWWSPWRSTETTSVSRTRQELHVGWQELVCSDPDADGFVTPVTPLEAVGKQSVIFRLDVVLDIRVNNGIPISYNTKILTFPTPIHPGGLPDMKFKNPNATHWVQFQ